MATPTELLAPPTEDQIDERLIQGLKEIPGNPISDWESGGVTKTIVELEKLADADLLQAAIPGVIGAGSIDFTDDGSATLVAKNLYGLDRTGAVTAQQTMTLTCDGTHGPYTIVANQFWFTGPTGNRWRNSTGGALATSGTLAITIVAEGPGAKYNDPAGTLHTYEPGLPGVTASNTAGDFTTVVSGGLSSGTATPSRTSGGVQPGQATFIIRIDSSGQVGAGAFSYSTNGGKTWVSGGVIGTAGLLLNGSASGTTVTFANGAGTPSFVAGDTFAFSTPGTSFLVQGKDRESVATLAIRCNARWPDLTQTPQESRYSKWAKAASTTVKRVRAEEDPAWLGRLKLTLAGLAGGVGGTVVATVQAYIDMRAPGTRIILVQDCSLSSVTAGGVVTVQVAKRAAVQAAAQAAWTNVILSTDIGGVARLADLVKAVMDAGAIDFQSPTLNGFATNFAVPATNIAVLPSATPLLANQLTWNAI